MKQATRILDGTVGLPAAANPGRGGQLRRGLGELALASLLLFLVGCLVPRRLEPASGERVAQASGLGLSMKADGEAWVGASATEDHSVPVWVELTNRGDTAVRVSYADWAMVAGGRAVPPIDPHPGLVLPPPSANGLAGSYGYSDRSWVAPVAYRPMKRGRFPGAIYPGQTGFRWQASRVGLWSPYGRTTVMRAQPIRTWDMVRLAVGEGDLEPGQTMAGFVYFPRWLLRERNLELTWIVRDTEGTPLGALGAEFRVKDASSPEEKLFQ